MGGPSFFIHLPRPLSAEAIEHLDARVRREMRHVTRARSSWEFWPAKPGFCQCSVAIVPFSCESAGNGKVSDPIIEDDAITAITQAVGYRPAESLQFTNYCRSDLDGHLLLARFAAFLAAEYEGVADLGGTAPPTGFERLPRIHVPFGICLLEPDAFERWCGHPGFYLEV